jgi:hypothetical protein
MTSYQLINRRPAPAGRVFLDLEDYTMTETTKRKTPDDFFGGCPHCGENHGYRNVRRAHYFICHTHKVKWLRGENLFSSWRHETEDDWKENARLLASFETVEPIFE